MRKMIIGYILFLALITSALFLNGIAWLDGKNPYQYYEDDGISYIARTQGKGFQYYDRENGWTDIFVTGVNMGVAKPGHFPGEFAITKEEYLRWFQYISELNVNTIRVYIHQTPEFYQALVQHNQNAEQPLFLMHGVHMNEEDIVNISDIYAKDGKMRKAFLQNVQDVVDIIHGSGQVKWDSGRVQNYTADVSPYVSGWILGIEFEADFVTKTNENNPQYTKYDGQYIYTDEVTPFEVFLAEAMDRVISYETEKYQEQRPVAVTNWVTTDPLTHPNEPGRAREDSVSIDAEKVHTKEGFYPGIFASYHVYPYYPDFFSHSPDYIEKGNGNTYKAYIEDLNSYHSMPLLISELGIPAARGITHENLLSGFNQGNVEESEQGRMLKSLISDIYSDECMGAIIFTWQDEWFKRTWNTMDRTIQERRAYWSDYQTSEQYFGLLSFDPGKKESVVYTDGDISEWDDGDVVTENDGYRLSMRSDEKYVYFLAEVKDFENETVYIPIDTIRGQGNSAYGNLKLGMDADFLMVISGKDDSKVLIDPYYDATYYEYAANINLHLSEEEIAENERKHKTKNTGEFVPIMLMLNKEIFLPQTQETIPYSMIDTGKLRYGDGNPSNSEFDSISDFYEEDNKVEIRIPWLLLNINDPSSGKAIGDLQKTGLEPQTAQPFYASIMDSESTKIPKRGMYTWKEWGDNPTYHERLKKSYYVLQDFFEQLDNSHVRMRTSKEILSTKWNDNSISMIANWFPIQPVLNYALAFLSSVIVYFFLALLYIHGVSAIRSRKKMRYVNRLSNTINGVQLNPEDAEHRVEGWLRVPTKRNLIIIAQVIEGLSEEKKAILRKLLLDIGYGDYLDRQMKSRDVRLVTLVIRIAGELLLSDRAEAVTQQIYKYPDDVDLAYQGLLTLARLGSKEQLLRIFMDGTYRLRLSFRSLQEVLKTYSGDKAELYDILLGSPDKYVVRICIKRIGTERLESLESKVIPFLENEDYNTVIDAARTLGMLKYDQAGEMLVPLLDHEKWEVRSISVNALAGIDTERYEKEIERKLHDSEWQVRYNAAFALRELPNLDDIFKNVQTSGDRYALDILTYARNTLEFVGNKS